MATKDKARTPKEQTRRSEVMEVAKAAIDTSDKMQNKQSEARDPTEVLGGLIDLYKAKTAVKGLQAMEQMLDKELSEGDSAAAAPKQAQRTMQPGEKPQQQTPLASYLPLLAEEERVAFIKSLMESDDKDLVYELMAGQNPGAKRLLGAMKKTETPAKPANDFESMTNNMTSFMKMMGLGSLVKTNEESSSMNNMLQMFSFFKEMMGGNNNNNNANSDLKDLIRQMQDSNKDMLRAIADSNNNTLNVIREAIVGQNSGSKQIELVQTFADKFSSQQGELVRTQLDNMTRQMEQKEEFWKAQYANQAQLLEQLKAVNATRPAGGMDTQALGAIFNQLKQLQDTGFLKQSEDKEIQLKTLEVNAELAKLDKTLAAQSTKTNANASNIAAVATLVSSFLDKSRESGPKSPSISEKPSKSVSRMAGVPAPSNPVGVM